DCSPHGHAPEQRERRHEEEASACPHETGDGAYASAPLSGRERTAAGRSIATPAATMSPVKSSSSTRSGSSTTPPRGFE
ncbi:MAG: hypothetical protein ABFS46_10520, partial [Myxococcota bacterium]